MKKRSLHFNLSDEAIAGYKFGAEVAGSTAIAGLIAFTSFATIRHMKHRIVRILAGSVVGTVVGVEYVMAILQAYRKYTITTKGYDPMEELIEHLERFAGRFNGDMDEDDFDDFIHDEFDEDFFDDDDDFVDDQPLNQEMAEGTAENGSVPEVDTTGNSEE